MTRNKDDHLFKAKALELCQVRGNTRAVGNTLGFKASLLCQWRKEHKHNGCNSFPGNGRVLQSRIGVPLSWSLWVLAVILVWLAFDLDTPDPAFAIKHFAFALVLLTGIWKLHTKGPTSRHGRLLWVLLIAGFVIQLVGTAWFKSWSWNVDALLVWALTFAAAWPLHGWVERESPAFPADDFIRAAGSVLLVTAITGLLVWWMGEFSNVVLRFPIGNPNLNGYAWAILLAIILPNTNWLKEYNPVRKWLQIGSVIFGLFALFLCDSRGAWLGLALGVFPYILLATKARDGIVHAGVWLGLVLLIGLSILVSTGAIQQETLAIRNVLWGKTLMMAADHPVLGVGPGRWLVELPAYGLSDTQGATGQLIFRRPHNEWLRVFAETGALGLLWLILLWGYGWWSWASKTWQSMRVKISAAAVGIVLTTALCFDFPLERLPLFACCIVWLVACMPTCNQKLASKDATSSNLFRLTLIVLVVFSAFRWFGWRAVEDVERERMAANWPAMLHTIDRAEQLGMRHNEFGMPLTWMEGHAHLAQGNLFEARIAFTAALQHAPNHILVLGDAASIYIMNNDFLLATPLLGKALVISEQNIPAQINLAVCRYNLGDKEAAKALIDGLSRDQCSKVEWETIKKLKN